MMKYLKKISLEKSSDESCEIWESRLIEVGHLPLLLPSLVSLTTGLFLEHLWKILARICNLNHFGRMVAMKRNDLKMKIRRWGSEKDVKTCWRCVKRHFSVVSGSNSDWNWISVGICVKKKKRLMMTSFTFHHHFRPSLTNLLKVNDHHKIIYITSAPQSRKHHQNKSISSSRSERNKWNSVYHSNKPSQPTPVLFSPSFHQPQWKITATTSPSGHFHSSLNKNWHLIFWELFLRCKEAR